MANPVCFNWTTLWPHAIPDVSTFDSTEDKAEVTCRACLWALGDQREAPPRCPECGYEVDSFACRIRHIHLNTGDAKASKDSG